MKHILFIATCFLFCFTKAQNLVPNGSFENIQNFPPPCALVGNETITNAVGWINPNNETPSLLNELDTIKCNTDTCPFLGVPSNFGGWQYARSGKGYADIAVINYGTTGAGLNNREYVQIKLIDSLRKNKTYCASLYVSLLDAYATYASSRVGCYFSQNAVSNHIQNLISVSPQVENPYGNILTNYTGWTAVQGTFTATGGENYITIGNFYDDANTDVVFSPNTGSGWCCAPNNYISGYYLDDVSLIEYKNAYTGGDTTICKGVAVSLGNNNVSFGANYNWSILKGDSSSLKYMDTLSYNIAQPKKTTTYVLQKKQCGIYSYDTLTIHIPNSFIAKVNNDTIICIGDSALISSYTPCSWCTYNWQPIQSQSQQVIVKPLANITYTLSVKDSCFTTYSHVIIAIDYCQSPIVIVPNIFTPNADGINDAWQPLIQNSLDMLNYQCTIYDRWGIKVFDASEALNNIAWDGHSTSGLECSVGTYYYVISYTDGKTTEKKNLKGFLELVK
ncbi:MAG TPA: gliding motility-associated C-terminal domain-containing protein [Bacteroidia bacterium]|nr:gliding motility-associated C-terminal domain-containing protein [Bacteroidia bacterium]